jgi:hypothetical protein
LEGENEIDFGNKRNNMSLQPLERFDTPAEKANTYEIKREKRNLIGDSPQSEG